MVRIVVFCLGIMAVLLLIRVSAGVASYTANAGGGAALATALGKMLATGELTVAMLVLVWLFGTTVPIRVDRMWLVPLLLALGCIGSNFYGKSLAFTAEAFQQPTLLESLSTGFFEELMFRGLILWFLLKSLGIGRIKVFVTVAITSVGFAWFHAGNIATRGSEQTTIQIIYAGFIGLIFGSLVLRTGRIIPVILLHALNNGLGTFVNGTVENTLIISPSIWTQLAVPGALALICLYLDFRARPLDRNLMPSGRGWFLGTIERLSRGLSPSRSV